MTSNPATTREGRAVAAVLDEVYAASWRVEAFHNCPEAGG
jgi:hypothetical protein